jgi:hypothetical protein
MSRIHLINAPALFFFSWNDSAWERYSYYEVLGALQYVAAQNVLIGWEVTSTSRTSTYAEDNFGDSTNFNIHA